MKLYALKGKGKPTQMKYFNNIDGEIIMHTTRKKAEKCKEKWQKSWFSSNCKWEIVTFESID